MRWPWERSAEQKVRERQETDRVLRRLRSALTEAEDALDRADIEVDSLMREEHDNG